MATDPNGASEQSAERIAKAFHDTYEDLAPLMSYRTREASAVPWEDVPGDNKSLMIATVRCLLTTGIIVDPNTEQKGASDA